jgi:flagellar hook-basal body complex protein FliE
MSISPIPPIAAVAPLAGTAATGATPATGIDFAGIVSRGLETLQATQDKADDLGIQAATGALENVHEYTIAAAEAALATKLTVAVRNKALEAFTEIMRMQA